MKQLFTLFTLLILCTSCSHTSNKVTQGQSLSGNITNIFTLDTVRTAPICEELTLNGKVTFNQKNVAQVFPTFGGQVTEILAEIGDYVHQGAPLAIIRSSEVSEYEKERKETEQKLTVAEHNLQYTQSLFDSGMASERDILQARQELANAQAEEKKINELFSIFKISNQSSYTLTAPVSGFIVEKNINPEMQLRSDQNEEVFVIAGLNPIWIMADVYEGDISKIQEKSPVSIKTLAYPDILFKGTVDKVYHVMDENSKTMKIRIELNNEKALLKPGMFANVKVQASTSSQSLPVVPSQSVIFENGKNYIITFNQQQPKIREVKIYKRTSTHCYLSSGVSPQESIVDKNALLIYNSLKTN